MSGDVIGRVRATLAGRAGEQAIEQAGVWLSWGEVSQLGETVVRLLDAAGCPPDGRVGVIIRNRAAHAATVVGLLAHGRPMSFLYPFLPPATLAEELVATGACAIVADEADWPGLHAGVRAAGAAGISLVAGPGAELVEGLERVGAAASRRDGSQAGVIEVLSSGTTGPAKRVPMPTAILERAVASAPGGEAGSTPPVQINVWPLGGVGGLCLLTAAAASGTPLVLIERFSVGELVDAIRRHRPPTLGLPPTAITMILDADVPPEHLASVKSISGGSAYLDPDVQDRFEAKYDLVILWAMGATEFCGTIARWTPQMRDKVGRSKRGSAGMAMPGLSLRVAEPDTGEVLPPGREGLLEVLCPTVRPDWVRTTDLVMIDEDGYVFHRGRYDGAIVRGGFKILPERIVEVLRGHPSVADAAVIGRPDPRLGATPVAAVELIAGAPVVGVADLCAHVRDYLPPIYVPTELRIVPALPRTPSLKVSLADLRRMMEPASA